MAIPTIGMHKSKHTQTKNKKTHQCNMGITQTISQQQNIQMPHTYKCWIQQQQSSR
jgi:hypothetical protein